MRTKISKEYLTPILLFAVVLLLILLNAFGSAYLGDYSSMTYMGIGASIYLGIKVILDFKSANKAIYVRYDEAGHNTKTVKFGKNDILNAISEAKSINDNTFLVKGLPITAKELESVLQKRVKTDSSDTLKQEIDAALCKMRINTINGMIAEDASGPASRLIYDNAVLKGEYPIKKNNVVSPDDLTVERLAGPLKQRQQLAISTVTKARTRNLSARQFEYSRLGGLLLYLKLNKMIRFVDA